MATTSKGIIYPTSGDNIAPLETHFANLANSTNTALNELSAGAGSTIQTGKAVFTSPASSGSTVNVTVTYPTAFLSLPTISAVVQGNSAYAVSIYGTPSLTGFVAKVYRLNESTSETLTLHWMAK